MMKNSFTLFLILCILILCGCSDISAGGNSSIDTVFTIEDQTLLDHDGLTVTAAAGEYTADPNLTVKNNSQQDLLIVVEAIVHNDVFQNLYSDKTVLRVDAGDEETLPISSMHGMLTAGFASVTTPEGSNGYSSLFVTSSVQKREYRFALYAAPQDGTATRSEENFLYRSDLLLLQTSNYDGGTVTKDLPTDECIFQENSVRIWWETGTQALYSYNVNPSTDPTGETAFSYSGTLSLGNGNFCVDNESESDILVELDVTGPAKPATDDSSDEASKEPKDDADDVVATYCTVRLALSVPAGKASRHSEALEGALSDLSRTEAWTVTIRIYDAAGELIAQQEDLQLRISSPSVGSDIVIATIPSGNED